VGGPTVDTALDPGTVLAGGTLSGRVEPEGGMAEPSGRPEARASLMRDVLHALAVLTPLPSALWAGALLVLGHALRPAGAPGTLPGSMVTAGWALVLIAAAVALVVLAAPLFTATGRLGGTGPSPVPSRRTRPASQRRAGSACSD
jgi:hypothetical protein